MDIMKILIELYLQQKGIDADVIPIEKLSRQEEYINETKNINSAITDDTTTVVKK